ncbi:DNA primase family protein [Ruminococcus difficilis]|uniref:SF3 helicase domain-containing protein n=1 Tax=Ruminococcus difficilis TaxID=2763069 RepID=A0A934TYN0_9FIRM|nr:phage/plasmid primase, P4 family [Ruminococcus difficilis]MBK6087872.1 hypothetical protein [Ruminococcus difficilis]
MARAIGELYESVAKRSIEKYSSKGVPPPEKARQELLGEIQTEVIMHNAAVGSPRLRVPTELPNAIISAMIRAFYPVRMISVTGNVHAKRKDCILCTYCATGENEGIYTQDDDELYAIAKAYKFDLTSRDFNEIRADLEKTALKAVPDNRYDSTIVANGIYNFTTGKLENFNPDRVFLCKPNICYNPYATNISISNPDGSSFDVDSWLAEIADDPEINDLFWEIINAVIRRVSLDVMILFYAPSGCNGKGTFLTLLRNIMGEENCASISLEKWAEKFDTSMIIGKSANFVDENAVKGYAASIDGLKASITNDVLTVQAKFKEPVAIRFRGTQIYCVNSLVRIGDGTESAYRRMLTVPFEKSFTGKENKAIKRDYLCRKEVLEYVVKKALEMGAFDEYTVPAKCEELKKKYMQNNDPIRDFLAEILGQCKWKMLPNSFLYELYKSWYMKYCTGKPQGRNTFLEGMRRIIQSEYSNSWRLTRSGGEKRNGLMDDAEPLIMEYNLQDWMNPYYFGSDPGKRCLPSLREKYEGIVKI